MWKILDHIKPSQRRALAGLDDIKNSGLTAFSVLEGLVEKLDIHQRLKKKLDRAVPKTSILFSLN